MSLHWWNVLGYKVANSIKIIVLSVMSLSEFGRTGYRGTVVRLAEKSLGLSEQSSF